MKAMKALLSILGLFLVQISSAQFVKTEQSIKVGEAHMVTETIINGEHVQGSPFLYDDWTPGKIVLQNEQVYEGYKLKFDVLRQAFMFQSGNDSLDVSDPIKEVILNTADGPKRYVNGEMYKKEKKPLFYEVVLDNPKGTLLKSYTKKVVSTSGGILEVERLKSLNLMSTYSYYDAATKKITSIKSTASLKGMLNLTPAQAESLDLNRFDLSRENDILLLFTTYFNL